MAKYYKARPKFAVPPGESVKETIENMGITKKEFATRLGITEQSLNRILNGKQPISPNTADGLERVTGVASDLWMDLEAGYQRQLRYLKQLKEEEKYNDFLKDIPYKELIKRRYIDERDNPIDQAHEALNFYKVASIEAYKETLKCNLAAARSSLAHKTEIDYAFTYQSMGLKEMEKIELEGFSQSKLKVAIKALKRITTKEPETFVKEAQDILAKAGVALIYITRFTGISLNALCKWVSPKRALIVINDKGKAEDIFWFSLFHEIGHLVLHSKKTLYLTYKDEKDEYEKEADEYAANILIPKDYDDTILQAQNDNDIKIIANEVGVSPGIVAGRYHHLTNNHARFRHLIRKVDIRYNL